MRKANWSIRDAIVPLGCLILAAYYGYNAMVGRLGLGTHAELITEISQLEAVYNDLKTQRAELEKRVALLHPDGVDPDLLDELARDVLNFAKPGDLLIWRDAPTGSAVSAQRARKPFQ